MFGAAIASSGIAAAAGCVHTRAGVGAAVSQGLVDPSLGPQLLDLMMHGASAAQAVEIVAADAEGADWRQIACIDAKGGFGCHSGLRAPGVHALAQGRDCVAAGCRLGLEGVPAVMVAAFTGAHGLLGDRLLAALAAGAREGGDEASLRSAGLELAELVEWPVASLRIDWSEGDPVGELGQLWARYKPQLRDGVTRALNPAAASLRGGQGTA